MKQKNILFAGMLVILAALVSGFVFFKIVSLPDAAMEPTYSEHTQILALKKYFSVERGNVVEIQSANTKLLRRVVGLPGETIEIKSGEILVNGKKLSESYITSTFCPASSESSGKTLHTLYGEEVSDQSFSESDQVTSITGDCPKPFILSDNEYFVLSDNTENTEDSRTFGLIAKEKITAKAVAKLPW